MQLDEEVLLLRYRALLDGHLVVVLAFISEHVEELFIEHQRLHSFIAQHAKRDLLLLADE